jgi:hypothetical protein
MTRDSFIRVWVAVEVGVGTVVKNTVLFTTILIQEKNSPMPKIHILPCVVNRKQDSNRKSTVEEAVPLTVLNVGSH